MKFGGSIEKLNNSDKEGKDKKSEGKPDNPDRRILLKKAGMVGAALFVGGALDGMRTIRKITERTLRKEKIKEEMTGKAWQDKDWVEGLEEKENKKQNKPEKKNDTAVLRKTQEEIKKIKGSEKRESEAEKIMGACFKAYQQLDWPKDLLPKDLLIAQQLQESRFDPRAKSHKGAVGIMQNMEASVIDVIRYLNKLERNKNFKFDGPKKLTNRQTKNIMRILRENADYSRVFGKIYLFMLADADYGYGVGYKEYKRGNIKSAQEKILASYNGGHRRIKLYPKWRWPRESRKYYKKIFNYKKRITNIRKAFKKNNIDADDYLVALLAKEMDKPRTLNDKYKLLDRYIKKVKQEKGPKSHLSHEEIRRIFISG